MNTTGNFTPVQFESPPIVSGIAETPRFGYGTQFEDLLGTPEQQKSYIIGVIIAGAVVLGFFLIWSLVLLILMCCGRRNVGFLSGRPLRFPRNNNGNKRVPSKRELDDEESFPEERESYQDAKNNSNNYNKKYPLCSKRPTRIRCAFLLCGAIFVAFSVTVVTEGLANLQSTIDVLEHSTGQVNLLATDALDIMQNGFLRAGQLAGVVREQLSMQLSNETFCPSDPFMANSEQGRSLRDQAAQATDQLRQLGDFMTSSIQQIIVPLQEVQVQAAKVEETIQPIVLTDWRAMLALIPFSLVPTLLMSGALMALFDATMPCYVCLINWIVLPVFILLVVVAWVVASGMIIAAGVNGDFCLPSGYYEGNPPDATIRNILMTMGYTNGTTYFQVADYFVSQCQHQGDPFDFIRSAQPELQANAESLVKLFKVFVDPQVMTQLSLYCNRDFSDLKELVGNMDTLVVLLVDAVSRTLDLVSCERIVPLYTDTVYQGVCTYSPSAVFWVFVSCLLMGLSGMVMLTFRAAYKKTIFEDPSDELVEDERDIAHGEYVSDDEEEFYDEEDRRRRRNEQGSSSPQRRRSSSHRGSSSRRDRDDYDDDDDDDDGRFAEIRRNTSTASPTSSSSFSSKANGSNDSNRRPSAQYPPSPRQSQRYGTRY